MTVKLYVEGGGDNKALQTECRRGFSEFLRKAGLEGRMPRIVACGPRRRAYDSFRTSHQNWGGDVFPVLLVDSEGPVLGQDSWDHVRVRSGDGWSRPDGASVDQLHVMVQAMEAWFHADKNALLHYYGQCFKAGALGRRPDIENIPKADLFEGMRRATKDCENGEYSKGRDSFKILSRIDPALVEAASPCAKRFLESMSAICKSE